MVLLISRYIPKGGGNLFLRGTIPCMELFRGNGEILYTRIDVRILYIP